MEKYRGESPGKKMARMQFWEDVITDRMRAPGQKIVVLASAFGGDVSCLKGFGVPEGNIVAVDRDEAALVAFSRRWPGVDARFGEVADVVEGMRERPVAAFLDFCGSLSSAVIDTSCRVMRRVALGGRLGVAVLKGREQNRGMGMPGLPVTGTKKEKKTLTMMKRGEYAAYMKSVGTKGDDSADKAMRRAVPLWVALCKSFQDRMANPNLVVSYQSSTDRSKGSPMAIVEFIVMKRIGSNGITRNHEAYERRIGGRGGVRLINCSFVDDEFIRNYCLEFDDDPNLYLKLNIPKMRVAAWKAHRTMGTYGEGVDHAAVL